MRKSLLLLTVLMSFMLKGLAQTSGGPDTYGYIWRDSNDPNGPVYNWIEPATGSEVVSGLSDDNSVGPFFLPSPFPYYWYTVDRFWIGSNGYISFGTANIASPFPTIPSTANPQNFLGVLLSDLNFDGAGNYGECRRWTNTTGDSVVVTWDSVPFWQQAVPTYTGGNSFQLILNYNDSSITFQYKDQNGITNMANPGFLTVGIENNSGNIGLQVYGDIMPPTQYAIRYYAPATTTLQINDASVTYNDNEENAAQFLSANGASFPLETEIKNSGNTDLLPFNVQTIIRNASNAIQLSQTTATDTILAGNSELITMANPFVPVTAGTYRMTTTTQLAGDATPSNNQRTLELQVVDTTQAEIELLYDNGTNGGGGISWSGGYAGSSNYFVPPFYPVTLTKVAAYIVTDASAVGYAMMVYDDNGPNGIAGTLLDSVFVAPGTFTQGAFTTSVLNTPLNITSGGFYVTWFMGGLNVTLGTDLVSSTNPASNRGFEVLANNYSEFRYRETQDFMIRAVITRVGVGTSELTEQNAGNFYPNPAADRVYLDLTENLASDQAVIMVFDMNGRMIYNNRLLSKNNRIELNVAELANGLYTVRIQDGKSVISRNVNVIH